MEGFIDCSTMMRGGVYLLMHKGQIVYIGKAKSFLARIYTHRSMWSSQRKGTAPKWLASAVKGILFDQIFLRPCRPDLVDALERELIAKHRPKHNIQHNPLGPDIRPVLAHLCGTPRPRPQIERRL